MTELEQAVLEIFRDELGIEVPGIEVDVIETGLLDSLGLIVLITEIEERFGVSIPFETLEIDQFRSVSSIAALAKAQRREEAP